MTPMISSSISSPLSRPLGDLSRYCPLLDLPQRTNQVIHQVQADGTCWCGGTEWQGRTAMRISVSSWATSDADVERCLETILCVANG